MTTTFELEIPTPGLVVDVDVLHRNIDSVHGQIKEMGVRLRPHVKTHKSLEIARLQLASGATGLTVATVGEAEVFAQVCSDVFIAYPLWPDRAQLERLARLADRARVAIGTDSTQAITHLAAGLDRRVELMIEVDSGHHRSGCAPAEAGGIARAAVRDDLKVRGVFTFPGHSYSPDGAEEAASGEGQALAQAAHLVREALGHDHIEVSGGSTPSVAATKATVVTETRPGVYVFNDAQQWELARAQPDRIALTAHARVVSRRGNRLVLDAGSKILGADRAPYATGFGRLLDHPHARIVQLSEHHAVADMPAGHALTHGDVVRVVPNHVCNAVNLVDYLLPVSGGQLRPWWPVDARGRNR